MPEWTTPELWPVWWVAISRSLSSTTTRRPGASASSRRAVASPRIPAPTTTTSVWGEADITAVSTIVAGEGPARDALLPACGRRGRPATPEVRDPPAGARGRDARPRPRRPEVDPPRRRPADADPGVGAPDAVHRPPWPAAAEELHGTAGLERYARRAS